MLTAKYQQQLIRDFIDGLNPPQVDIDQLTDPYDWLFDYLHDTNNTDRRYVLFSQLAMQDDEWRSIVEDTLALVPGEKTKFKNVEQVGKERPPTTWLWKNWLPKGYLSALAGFPGQGKTYFSLNLIHLIASGSDAPDGEPFHNLTSQTTIFVDGEDFAAEAWRRVSVWNMNPNHMYIYEKPRDAMIDFTNPAHQDQLREMCYTLKPDLVLVDSLSTVSPSGENSVEDVRSLLSFLIEVAQDYNTAVCLLHHLSKPKKGTAPRLTMHDLRGSGHIVAMTRCIIGLDLFNIGSDNDNGPRIIKSLKNNLGKVPFPIRLDFEPNPENPDLANLTYTAMDLFTKPEQIQSEPERCAEWLVGLLEEYGPLPYSEIILHADDKNFTRYTVGKAREALGSRIVDTVGSGQPGNKWTLADDEIDLDDLDLSGSTKTDACARWLLALLTEHKELPLNDIQELAEENDFSINIILRARKKLDLQVVDTKGPKKTGNKWALADWFREGNQEN